MLTEWIGLVPELRKRPSGVEHNFHMNSSQTLSYHTSGAHLANQPLKLGQ